MHFPAFLHAREFLRRAGSSAWTGKPPWPGDFPWLEPHAPAYHPNMLRLQSVNPSALPHQRSPQAKAGGGCPWLGVQQEANDDTRSR